MARLHARRLWSGSFCCFCFLSGTEQAAAGLPSDRSSVMTLRSEQGLEAEPRSSVFWGRNLASSPSAEGKGRGACGEQGGGAGFPPPLHPWPLTSWALTWPAGALQPALLWTQNFEQVFLRDKVTLSFSSPPILVACRGLDAGRTAWFPYLLRSSRTLKELNGKENRSYCLFCFLFKTYKKTLNPWSGLLQPQDCFLCHGNMLHKRLFPGLAP